MHGTDFSVPHGLITRLKESSVFCSTIFSDRTKVAHGAVPRPGPRKMGSSGAHLSGCVADLPRCLHDSTARHLRLSAPACLPLRDFSAAHIPQHRLGS
jgi:hypothetical protein